MANKQGKNRASHSKLEYRRKIADKVLSSNRKQKDIAKELGINASTLGSWVAKRRRELKKQPGLKKGEQRSFTYQLRPASQVGSSNEKAKYDGSHINLDSIKNAPDDFECLCPERQLLVEERDVLIKAIMIMARSCF